jgi:hypothetical protein
VSDVVKPGQAPCDRDGCTNKATHAYFRCLNHPMPAAPIEKAQPQCPDCGEPLVCSFHESTKREAAARSSCAAGDDVERFQALWDREVGGTTDTFMAALLREVADVRREMIEVCAKAIEADRDRVFEKEGVMLGEMCMYDVCAITVRRVGQPVPDNLRPLTPAALKGGAT